MALEQELQKKYDKLNGKTSEFESTFRASKFVKYQINFINGNSIKVIMTDAQLNGLRRSQAWSKIKSTGGLGHQKRK